MAKLQNVFSWSHSAAGAFETCRRKRYWSKYGAWGGWERDASPECRTAYRLNKMTNRFQLYGIAAEEAVMWMLKRHQEGVETTDAEVFDTVARPLLRRAWDESKEGAWRKRAKAACLHEHYYPAFTDLADMEIMKQIAEVVKTCIANFRRTVLPELARVTPEMEVAIQTVGRGDPEHFLWRGFKIYAIPDYVYVEDGVWHILDWKAGAPKPEHAEQIALYALWARERHGIPPEQVVLRLEYLGRGEHKTFAVTAEDLAGVEARIGESVQDMCQYLVEADPERNQALPRFEWDLCYDPGICRHCEFFELCRPELRDAMGPEFDSAFSRD